MQQQQCFRVEREGLYMLTFLHSLLYESYSLHRLHPSKVNSEIPGVLIPSKVNSDIQWVIPCHFRIVENHYILLILKGLCVNIAEYMYYFVIIQAFAIL
jgi:hypothetical protein